ncbi:MAG TPA: glycosyltransferase [Acidimicrobiia bacterium]|nr:glycosyltransferase [Acidimicrobiia bacterium]
METPLLERPRKRAPRCAPRGQVLASVADAPAWRQPRSRAGRWMSGLDPATWRAVRRGLVMLALVPLMSIVAAKADHIVHDPILGAYGVAVTFSTVILMYLAFVRYRDPSLDVPMTGLDDVKVSFLVAVKNEEHNIEDCVLSILGSDHRNLEVFVVNDGSTDRTGEILERLAREHPDVHVLTMENSVGKKRALVAAARHATGTVFAFTDSDCILAPDALRRCVAVLVHRTNVGGVSGHARALNADRNVLTKTQDVWYDGQFTIGKAAESSFGSVTCVSGPLAVFRKEAIYNYLPAWANDRFAGQEFLFATDRQLTGYVLGQRWKGQKLKAQFASDPLVSSVDYRARAWRIEYLRSARVWTNVPSTTRDFFKQQARWKKSFIRNLFFNGPYIWRRGFGPAALFYLHALWVVAAPIMFFRHLVWLPAHTQWLLVGLYLAGVFTKGAAFAIAYKAQNRHCTRWVYRPLMSLLSSIGLSWLILYSAATVRKGVWHRA